MKHVTKRSKSDRRYNARYCSRNIKKFFTETTLHGLKFIVDDKLSIWERLIFLLALAISMIVTSYLAAEIYVKWQSTPVIIGRNSYATPINTIPFPAITICNMNQVKRSRVESLPPDSMDRIYLKRACLEPFNFSAYKNFKPRKRNDTLSNFIMKSSQNCSDMIVNCKFGSEIMKCTNLFREVIMDEGLCCAFNTLHPYYAYKGTYNINGKYVTATYSGRIPIDWSPEKGYPKEVPTEYYPMRAKGAGASLGFSIILNADIGEYYCSSTNGAGFKISLNNPIDTPQIKETGLPVMIGRQSRFRIDSTSYEALANIRSTKPQLRYCYFNDEKDLFYFKYYTRRNCEMECNSKLMLKICKCIPHHLPKIYSNASECNIGDFDCVSNSDQIKDEESVQCRKDCLPSCFDISYLPKVFTTPFARTEFNMREPYLRNLSKDFIHENLAQVQFYYKDFVFHSRVRTSYTAFTDFLSQIGGIMSFLMGFSVVSIAEISYYTIWRPIFEVFQRIRQRRRINVGDQIDDVKDISNKTNDFIMYEKGEHFRKNIFNGTQSNGLILADRAAVKRKSRTHPKATERH